MSMTVEAIIASVCQVAASAINFGCFGHSLWLLRPSFSLTRFVSVCGQFYDDIDRNLDTSASKSSQVVVTVCTTVSLKQFVI
jgi:hypothetical protein